MFNTEYLDVLDEKGNKTGKKKLRTEIHRDGDWHKSVHVWILNSKNELLIQKRALNKDSSPGMWDISVAGHVEAGQSAVTTALLEVKEELGITVKEKKLKYLFTVIQGGVLNNGKFKNNEFDEVYLLKIDFDVNKVVLQKAEVSEIKFIYYKDLEKQISNNKVFVQHEGEYKKLFKKIDEIIKDIN